MANLNYLKPKQGQFNQLLPREIEKRDEEEEKNSGSNI